MMNQKYIIIVVVVGVIALGIFGYSTLQGPRGLQEEQEFVAVEEVIEEEQAAPAETTERKPVDVISESAVPEPVPEQEEELVLPEDPTLEQRFEYTLNVMLRDVAQKAAEYKKQRKVMTELVKPENLGNKEYVAENFELLQQTSQELNQKAAEILEVFEKADTEIHTLAQGYPEEGRANVLEKWSALKTDRAGAYQSFFALEQDVIQAHERLMRFYFNKRDYYDVNAETGEITFQKESDQRLANTLQLQLNRLNRSQNNVLRTPEPASVSTEQ